MEIKEEFFKRRKEVWEQCGYDVINAFEVRGEIYWLLGCPDPNNLREVFIIKSDKGPLIPYEFLVKSDDMDDNKDKVSDLMELFRDIGQRLIENENAVDYAETLREFNSQVLRVGIEFKIRRP